MNAPFPERDVSYTPPPRSLPRRLFEVSLWLNCKKDWLTEVCSAAAAVKYPRPMDINPEAMAYGLAVIGLVWYLIMWLISLLGCLSAYVLKKIFQDPN